MPDIPAISADLLPPQPAQNTPVIQPDEEIFSVIWRNYLAAVDTMFSTAQYGPFVNAANDSAAAALGVPVDGVYRNGSVVMVRVT